MNHSRFTAFFLVSILWVSLLISVHARDAKEDTRIEALIQTVSSLKEDAVFIRNGSNYNGKDAAEHLRLKLKNAGKRIRTAEDFIEGCASKSSVSGEKYRIRMKDGIEIDSGTFLKNKLKEIDEKK